MASNASLIEAEVGRVVGLAGGLWEAFRDASIFITGGTGFFGRWLLETLARADAGHRLNLRALVLTRDAAGFLKDAPALGKHRAIQFLSGDVRDFPFPKGSFSLVIHGAAASARETFNKQDALVKFDTAVEGTRRVLEFARQCGAGRMLFVSSGSVYGTPPAGMERIPEDYPGAPATGDLVAALSHGKRAAEFLCAYQASKCPLEIPIARCFSFVGPCLPLDIHYGIGNFIRDALHADRITVQGDGRAMRSYMYVGDCIVWLLTLLLRGRSARVYNVGSDQPISMRDLAYLVRDTVSPKKEVALLGKDVEGPAPSVYVPDLDRARGELGLDAWTALQDAIAITARSYGFSR